jgi:hypothetical protein
MKRFLWCAAVLMAASLSCAQSGEQRVYRSDDVTFYGLDFSFLKLIHEDGFIDKNGKPMCNTLPFKYFNEWNEMFMIEKNKYSITRYFGFPDYKVDQTKAGERNKAWPFVENCISENEEYTVTASQIAEVLGEYGSPNASGLGLVIFVESMNKTKGDCFMQVVFFDIGTHEVVKMSRVEGTPVGYGFRNYWANAIDNALDNNSKEYTKGRKGK